MNCVTGSPPLYGEMAESLYAKASDLGTEVTKLPGQAMDAGLGMLSEGYQACDKVVAKLSKFLSEGLSAGKDYVANQADFVAIGLSKIDPLLLGVDLAVVTSSIFGSGLLALSALEDAKNGEKTKAALKGSASLAVAGAGAYDIYALGCKTITLAAASHQEALDSARHGFYKNVAAATIATGLSATVIGTTVYNCAMNHMGAFSVVV